jgi:ribosomal protein S5
LKNLTHIDLYDNFGLAHDVVGKRNGCTAYIRSTPSTRAMIANEDADDILKLFGIATASVKLVGNKSSYARVYAIFDALKKHQNIDEYSKARGKRYLSEKWLHEQGAK